MKLTQLEARILFRALSMTRSEFAPLPPGGAEALEALTAELCDYGEDYEYSVNCGVYDLVLMYIAENERK